jgi:hypothetical protein
MTRLSQLFLAFPNLTNLHLLFFSGTLDLVQPVTADWELETLVLGIRDDVDEDSVSPELARRRAMAFNALAVSLIEAPSSRASLRNVKIGSSQLDGKYSESTNDQATHRTA